MVNITMILSMRLLMSLFKTNISKQDWRKYMKNKKTVKIILKSGYEISILCDNFKVTYNPDTTVKGY